MLVKKYPLPKKGNCLTNLDILLRGILKGNFKEQL